MSQAEPSPSPKKQPELEQFEDALYELVSGGLPASANRAPVGAIQQFLHEHARNAKSKDDFAAFFNEHELEIPDAAGFGGTHRFDIPVPPLMDMPAEREPTALSFGGELLGEDDTRPVVLEAASRASGMRKGMAVAMWLALGAIVAALGVAGWWGYGTITALQGDLKAAEVEKANSREAIERLRERQADIESNVAATGQVMQQVDAKSDLLLESVTALQKPKPRWKRRK
jgi:hypothetical protein